MKYFFLSALCAVAFSFAPAVSAQVKFETPERAVAKSATTGKAVFLVSYIETLGLSKSPCDQVTAILKADAALAKSFERFEFAAINVGGEEFESTNYMNPELTKKYGLPVTFSAYACGASKHLWRKSLADPAGKELKEPTNEEITSCMKEAAEAWSAFAKPVNELEEKCKADKKARQDPATHVSLAEAWAKGFAAAKARSSFDEAVKLYRKADKADTRIDATLLRAAEVEFQSEAWDAAVKSFDALAKSWKDNEQAWHARIMSAKATAMKGDKAAAKKALAVIAQDKKAPQAAQTDAQKALDEINALDKK